MEFWVRVKNQIRLQNTTQDWVAAKISVRADTFSRWIQRDTFPRVDQAVAIAKALDTTVEHLVTGESESFDFLITRMKNNMALQSLMIAAATLPQEKLEDLVSIAEVWQNKVEKEREAK